MPGYARTLRWRHWAGTLDTLKEAAEIALRTFGTNQVETTVHLREGTTIRLDSLDTLNRRDGSHCAGFTSHALERFSQRAGIGASSWQEIEVILRDLLYQEGRVVQERPRWARSRNTADVYIQVGEWLLLICRHDELRRGAVSVVTIVNGPEENTWQRALELGYIATPMPQNMTPPQRPYTSFWGSLKIAHCANVPGQPGIFSRIVATHRARREQAQATYKKALQSHRELVVAYENQRRCARENHLNRYGTRS